MNKKTVAISLLSLLSLLSCINSSANTPEIYAAKISNLNIAKCRTVGSSFKVLGMVTKDSNLEKRGDQLFQAYTVIGMAKFKNDREAMNNWTKNNKSAADYDRGFIDRVSKDFEWGNDEFVMCASLLN
jgi:hypothetical protein